MKKRLLALTLALSLLLAAGTVSARGGHGGGGRGGGGRGFHGGAHWGGRSAAGVTYVRPYYGYYGPYPYPVWMPGYWTESCTPEYCEPLWVPGYWRH